MDSIDSARTSNRVSAVDRSGAPLAAWAAAILVAVSGFAMLALSGSPPIPSPSGADARSQKLESRAEVMQRRCGRAMQHDGDESGE